MTDEEIDQLQPGEILDGLIAVNVFGWSLRVDNSKTEWPHLIHHHYTSPDGKAASTSWFDDDGSYRGGSKPMECGAWFPEYSEDVAAAWTVVEAMMKRHTQDFHFGYRMCPGCNWRFSFQDKVGGVFGLCAGAGASMPLAVCRAALKAVAQGTPVNNPCTG